MTVEIAIVVMKSEFFCCFKQKTADDMRISDWSSDVCSSDLENLDILCREREEKLPRRVFARNHAGDHHPVGVHDARAPFPTARQAVAAFYRVRHARSEARRVGKECGSPCTSRWSPYHSKQKLSTPYRFPTLLSQTTYI